MSRAEILDLASRRDALGVVRYTYGHIPHQSMVVLGLIGDAVTDRLRIDLDGLTNSSVDECHRIAGWLTADPDWMPEAVAVMLLDQSMVYSSHQLDGMSLELEAALALRHVRYAVEHRVSGEDGWREELSNALDLHPELTSQTLMPQEVSAQWIASLPTPGDGDGGPTKMLSSYENRATSLLGGVESPDWEAITQFEHALDRTLSLVQTRAQRDTMIALKAMVAHAQGRGMLARDLLAHTCEDGHPFVDSVKELICDVHPFALRMETSFASWQRFQQLSQEIALMGDSKDGSGGNH